MATPELPGGDDGPVNRFKAAAEAAGRVLRDADLEAKQIVHTDQELVFPQAYVIIGI